MQPPMLRLPSQDDPVARAATGVIGGPVGVHAVIRTGWVRAATTLVALSSTMVAGAVMLKGSCLASGWTEPKQYWRACYSDIPVAYLGAPGGKPGDTPPLLSVAMWLVGLVTPGEGVARQQWYFGIWALVAVVVLAAAVMAMAWADPTKPWRAAHMALSPVLLTVGLASADILGVALMAWGLALLARRHVIPAGVLLGAAATTRFYPVLVLVAVLLVGAKRRELADAGRVVAAAGMTVAVLWAATWAVLGPAVTSWPRAWFAAGPGFGSILMVPNAAGALPKHDPQLATDVATGVSLLGLVMALVVGAALVLLTRTSATVPVAALVMVAITMATSKSLPVQHSLWVVPLVAMTAVLWRDHLIWALFDMLHFVMLWMYMGSFSDVQKGLPVGGYAVFALLRCLAVVWLAGRAFYTQEHEWLASHRAEPDPDVRAAPSW